MDNPSADASSDIALRDIAIPGAQAPGGPERHPILAGYVRWWQGHQRCAYTARGTVRALTPPPQMLCSAPRTPHVSCSAAHADQAGASDATIGASGPSRTPGGPAQGGRAGSLMRRTVICVCELRDHQPWPAWPRDDG